MKKSIVMLAVTVLGGVWFGTAQSVSADDVLTLPSKATVELEKGTLKLEQVPNLEFGAINLDSITSTHKATSDENIAKVINNLGDDSTWKLSVKGTPFTTGDSKKTLENAVLKLTTSDQKTSIENVIGGGGTLVESVEAGESSVSFNAENTVLDLSKVPATNLKVGNYTSALTWTLSDTEETKSAI